ncbi:CvpA family protein [Comamonas aquatica]|uniref:CvpA family protein n=1 Tax=Comamonas aquatica TaxID=225991 RepID=UPI0005ED2959|nr:CvpA family protein [Comamonas aquatica]ANY62152.1 colicin V synthesis protein [Comamonas aquatica]MDH0371553.1 CvpA family protein [Comamonas aquatica]
MAVLDGVLLGILLVSMLLGAWRGLVFELFSLVGWVAGFFIARLFAPDVAAWLPLESWDGTVRYGVGFVLTFVVAVFAWGLLSALAKKLIEVAGLRPVDRTLGAVFGLLRAVVLILVLAVVVVSTSLRTQDWWTQSVAAPWLGDAVASILPALDLQLDHLLPGT